MFVYFISSGLKGPIKIGLAKDVEKRRDDLQTGNPNRLHIQAKVRCRNRKEAEKLEKILHKKFTKSWIRGEWFKNNIRLSSVHEIMEYQYETEGEESEDQIEKELDLALLNG